jgi:hypothetical protein
MHRLARAGGGGDLSMMFAADALDLIIEASLGTPRRLLTLAHATLEEAALRGHPRALNVDAEVAIRSRGMKTPSAAPEAEERTVSEPEKTRRWPWLAFRFP